MSDKWMFELTVTRVKRQVTKDMPIHKRVSAHTFNMMQKRTYTGLVKLFVDGFKIKREQWKDDDVQVIVVRGTETFCKSVQEGIEGIDSEKVISFVNESPNQQFINKMKRKVRDVIDSVKNSGFEAFKQTLAAGGILIMMDVHEEEIKDTEFKEHE